MALPLTDFELNNLEYQQNMGPSWDDRTLAERRGLANALDNFLRVFQWETSPFYNDAVYENIKGVYANLLKELSENQGDVDQVLSNSIVIRYLTPYLRRKRRSAKLTYIGDNVPDTPSYITTADLNQVKATLETEIDRVQSNLDGTTSVVGDATTSSLTVPVTQSGNTYRADLPENYSTDYDTVLVTLAADTSIFDTEVLDSLAGTHTIAPTITWNETARSLSSHNIIRKVRLDKVSNATVVSSIAFNNDLNDLEQRINTLQLNIDSGGVTRRELDADLGVVEANATALLATATARVTTAEADLMATENRFNAQDVVVQGRENMIQNNVAAVVSTVEARTTEFRTADTLLQSNIDMLEDRVEGAPNVIQIAGDLQTQINDIRRGETDRFGVRIVNNKRPEYIEPQVIVEGNVVRQFTLPLNYETLYDVLVIDNDLCGTLMVPVNEIFDMIRDRKYGAPSGYGAGFSGTGSGFGHLELDVYESGGDTSNVLIFHSGGLTTHPNGGTRAMLMAFQESSRRIFLWTAERTTLTTSLVFTNHEVLATSTNAGPSLYQFAEVIDTDVDAFQYVENSTVTIGANANIALIKSNVTNSGAVELTAEDGSVVVNTGGVRVIGVSQSSFDALGARVDTAETEITSLDTRLTNEERNVDTAQTDIITLTGRVTTAETDIDNLDTRLTNDEALLAAEAEEIGSLDTRVTNIEAWNIGNLGDVDTSTAPTDGQALVWDATNSMWEPGDVQSSGGGGTYAFAIVDTSTAGAPHTEHNLVITQLMADTYDIITVYHHLDPSNGNSTEIRYLGMFSTKFLYNWSGPNFTVVPGRSGITFWFETNSQGVKKFSDVGSDGYFVARLEKFA